MTWQSIHSLPWSSIWDAFTAIGTVAMAITTAVIIYQNRREHQDAFRPICVLVPEEGLDQFARRDVLQCHEEPGKPGKYYLVKCGIQNVGGGPALGLRLIARFSQHPGIAIEGELAPVGAKQTWPSPLKIPVILRDQFNRMDYEVAPGEVWDLWLVYEDMFGNIFHTRHTKNPQQPWCVYGKGAMI